jgi:hypothetical protein
LSYSRVPDPYPQTVPQFSPPASTTSGLPMEGDRFNREVLNQVGTLPFFKTRACAWPHTD